MVLKVHEFKYQNWMGCAKVMRMKLIDYFGPLFYSVVDLQVVCLVKSTTPQASLHFYPHRINEGCYFFFTWFVPMEPFGHA